MGAYIFDGVDDSLSIESILGLTDYPFTIGVWYRPSATGTRWLAGFVDKDVNNRHHRLGQGGVGPGIQAGSAAANTINNAVTSTSISINTWMSAVGVWAAQNDRRSFLDAGGKGTAVTSRAWSSAIDRFVIGRKLDTALSEALVGHIAYVFVWGVVLSDTEVVDWDNGDIPQEGNLIAVYDLTQDWGSGPVEDLIGGFDLTINGATFDSGETPPVLYDFGLESSSDKFFSFI